jgi:CheY-like chemotaxis protein
MKIVRMDANKPPSGRQYQDLTEAQPDQESIRLVRDALTRLFDAAHLQDHPLCEQILPQSSVAGTPNAQALRRLILDTIELLRPAAHVPYNAKEWRPYRVLTEQYVQHTPSMMVAQELAISERQYQREHARALRALANLLWSHVQHGAADEDVESTPNGENGVTAEVDRMVAGAQREALSAHELVQSVVQAVDEMARSRGVEIVLNAISPATTIYGDRALLRQALLNILSYLVTYADADRLAITVTGAGPDACDHAKDDLQISFCLRCRAPGEDSADSDDRDVTAQDLLASPRLALSHQLAEKLGGSLCADSESIHLYLPSQREVLLVVDDNQDVIDMFQRFLAAGRYRVVGANSAQEALALARTTQPSLIMLDVMMPGHDGWEALQSLKHNPETGDIPVIICSILNERELAFSLGADDYVQKPVTQQELLSLLSRWDTGI